MSKKDSHKKYLNNWFNKQYLTSIKDIRSLWIDVLNEMVLDKEQELTELDSLKMMNQFIEEIFPKYSYYSLRLLIDEFNLDKEVDKSNFKLPKYSIMNMDDF